MHSIATEKFIAALNPFPTQELKPALLEELRGYLGLPPDSPGSKDDELYQRCKGASAALQKEWEESKIDPSNQLQVQSFYQTTQQYLFELLALEIDAPESRHKQLEELVELLKREGKTRGVDYGSGIGTLGLYLNRHGVHCDFADLSQINLEFIQHRLKIRNLPARKRTLLSKEKLVPGNHDFITAFDVFEHLEDPLDLVLELTQLLNEGGLLIFNLLEGEAGTPHILKDLNGVRKKIRSFGMTKVGSIGEFKIYRKVQRPPWANHLLKALDTAFWNLKSS